MSKLAFRAQTVDIACLPLRQDFLVKNVLMTTQRDFGLGNSLQRFDPKSLSWSSESAVAFLVSLCGIVESQSTHFVEVVVYGKDLLIF